MTLIGIKSKHFSYRAAILNLAAIKPTFKTNKIVFDANKTIRQIHVRIHQ